MIRILHVIGRMNRGGAETMIMNLYRNIDRTKVQFDFVEHYDERAVFDDEIESLGGKIFRCPRYVIINHYEYQKWWNSFFKDHSEEFAVIHGHIGSSASIYLSIAKKFGLFTIAHSHSARGIISFRDLVYKIISYNTRYIADYFFGCSELAGVSRYGIRTVNGKYFSVLNNAINTSDYKFDNNVRTKMRSELSVEKDDFVIGHVGRFDKAKNQQFLVHIFKSLQQYCSNSKLVLVGTGEDVSQIENLVEELGLKEKVIFTGVRSDVNELLQAFDVFVFPSLYEGLPVTLVEAQAAGLPCVISDTITNEVSLTNLVNYKSLNDSYDSWADAVLNCIDIERKDMSEEIISAGYDIKTTARWLTDFYFGITKNYN